MFWMMKAKTAAEWDHTASILAMIHNVASKRKKSPLDFHPYGRERKKGIKKKGATLADFKAALRKEKSNASKRCDHERRGRRGRRSQSG